MLSRPNKRLLWSVAALLVLGTVAGATYNYEAAIHQQRAVAGALTGGDPMRGAQLFQSYGCGACHRLSGAAGAQGMAGPPLDTIGQRAYIAGKLRNQPDNLMRWIENPQAVTPGTAMPNLGVKPNEARDLAAYLYAPQ